MSDLLELRPEVAAFAQAMERKLRKHDEKRGVRGWESCEVDWLLARCGEERDELIRTVEDVKRANRFMSDDSVAQQVRRSLRESSLDEAADVANFAMMIADVCGGLKVSA